MHCWLSNDGKAMLVTLADLLAPVSISDGQDWTEAAIGVLLRFLFVNRGPTSPTHHNDGCGRHRLDIRLDFRGISL